VVNFINVKHARFLYERHLGSFSRYMYVVKAAETFYENFVRLTLMKFTTGGSHNTRTFYLQFHLSLAYLRFCDELKIYNKTFLNVTEQCSFDHLWIHYSRYFRRAYLPRITSDFTIRIVLSLYRWTSLYARDRDSKNMIAYNEFAYKKTNDHCK